jgi:hypothetical protein
MNDKIFRATFTGRKINAIGIMYPIVTLVTGSDEDMARLELYNTHEHVTRLKLEELEVVCIRNCKPGDKICLVKSRMADSDYTVVEGDNMPGFQHCRTESTGVIVQLNDGMLCVVR